MSLGVRTAILVAVGVSLSTGSANVRAEVGLEWRPSVQSVDVGQTVEVGLYAVSETGVDRPIAIVESILHWDPAALELLGLNENGPYEWFISAFPNDEAQDGLNAPFSGDPPFVPDNDGDAWYNAVSQFPPAPPADATPDGLLVVSFQFTALSGGATQLELPAMAGKNTNSQVWDGEVAGVIITGTLGPPAIINVIECQVDGECDDGVGCTDDSCVDNACVNTPNDSFCADDGEFCNGSEFCDVLADCTSNGDPCLPGEFCNETTDACDECVENIDCADGEFCNGDEVCVAGSCEAGTDPCPGQMCMESTDTCVNCLLDTDCDDSVDCTVDTCDPEGNCLFTPDSFACPDDGVFCNGTEICDPANGDPVTGCTSSGEPCPKCSEEFGCGSCDPPLANSYSSRYIEIIPAAGNSPVALVVTTCGGTNPQYVGAWTNQPGLLPIDLTLDSTIDGFAAQMVDDPADALWLTPAEWGGTVWATGLRVVPGQIYDVQADCGEPGSPALTTAVSVETWVYGDVNDNAIANLEDVFLTVQAFQGLYVEGNTQITSDIGDCLPEQVHNLGDSLLAINAFQATPFSASCPESYECP
ncbi:MAG: hypothetical protein ACYTHJ_10060 [Planctomycetota bacterium]|jgi:hypothetical protein